MDAVRIDKVLDIKGLICPKPIVMTVNTLKSMDKGQVLQVVCSDSTTKISIPILCERSSFTLLDLNEGGGIINFIIQK